VQKIFKKKIIQHGVAIVLPVSSKASGARLEKEIFF
jgi:hypothetical protein